VVIATAIHRPVTILPCRWNVLAEFILSGKYRLAWQESLRKGTRALKSARTCLIKTASRAERYPCGPGTSLYMDSLDCHLGRGATYRPLVDILFCSMDTPTESGN
jgi:hypothetical protein